MRFESGGSVRLEREGSVRFESGCTGCAHALDFFTKLNCELACACSLNISLWLTRVGLFAKHSCEHKEEFILRVDLQIAPYISLESSFDCRIWEAFLSQIAFQPNSPDDELNLFSLHT